MEDIGSKTTKAFIEGDDPYVVEKPFVEVKLIPGENSNQAMLSLESKVSMLSETQI